MYGAFGGAFPVAQILHMFWVLPPPVTVYIRGPIKGYIYPSYNYYPTVTERGQYPTYVAVSSLSSVLRSEALNS